MNSISLLELLENELLDNRGYLRRKPDLNRCANIVEELKQSLPDCIREAQKIVDTKRQILQNADTVAKNTISTAEQKAKSMISQSEVGNQAQLEARKIVNKAAIQKDVLIDKTKAHLDVMFEQTEQFLLGLLTMVRKNRRELHAIVFN